MKIKNTKPKAKPFKVAAGRGLHLLVKVDGSKHWHFRYRFNGKENTISLGRYPEVTLLDAETKATEAHAMLDKGINPSEAKKVQKQVLSGKIANSFEVIAREWLDSFFVNKSASHKEKTLRRLEVYLFPYIGNKPISDITAPEVLEAVRRPQNQNKLETAHRALQVAGQVFRYAVQNGKALRDVTADLKGALPPANVKHMASFTEPKDVAELLRAIDGFVGTLTVECALRLAPLVFTRPSELRKAKWAEIDLDAGEWRFLVTKTNTEHIVPLSTQAIKILKFIQPVSGYGEYVFQGGHDPKKPMSEAAINASLKRMGYDTKTQITGHGFRAMARTILHERLNIDPHIIEHQLAHAVPDNLGGAYNRTKFLDQRKAMMQQWADYLDELKAGAKVISIHGKSA
ncbi:MAG TPA: integrase [Methylophilaceae bacterium]|nr:integrase [Methylophilaceae bacterium]